MNKFANSTAALALLAFSAIPAFAQVVGGSAGGSGTGGAGDASAANQTSQITAEQAIQSTLGAKTDAKSTATDTTSISAMQVWKQISAYLASLTPPALDAATSGQTPSTIACNTLSATPTAGTTAHTNPVSCDLYGNLITQPYALPQNRIQGAITSAMTGTTSTLLLAAPGASLFNYITSISCQNSHATVGTLVAVQDGSGGTTMFHLATASLFGGDNTVFPTPWKQTTANNALYVANVTTGASVTCKATGFKGP